MKTIISNETNVSLYIFADDVVVDIAADKTNLGNPVNTHILDCNSSNVTLYEGVTPPDEWKSHKYLFDGTNWTANPNYNPRTPPAGQE
jgi:phosphatidylethanolamine-binding protein (PEBP) family uncharacterized protein